MVKELVIKPFSTKNTDIEKLIPICNIDFKECLSATCKQEKFYSLVSCISYIEKINPYTNSNIGLLQTNEDLQNEKLRNLIYNLAQAIDKNSVTDIKKLKTKYGKTNEFLLAKNFLNEKCKEVWNVFDNKNKKLFLPLQAMKALGISNQPTMDFLLENSLKYFEKENSTTTVDIICSMLNNENIFYNFEDILKYLQQQKQKGIFEYNSYTVLFLAKKLKFNKTRLMDLQINRNQINEIFTQLSMREKLQCICKYYLSIN